MKRKLFLFTAMALGLVAKAQTDPCITKWLQNTTVKGTYFQTAASTTAITNNVLVNCQKVQYDNNTTGTNYVYIKTEGMPAYPVGDFSGDGNTNEAGAQGRVIKIPRNPVEKTGTKTSLAMGSVAFFINGVAAFDYRDGVSWKSSTNSFAGGPGGGTGDGVWNRDAIVYEKLGFDCSKGHPAGTNYHHHQNPTAFKNDLVVLSTICTNQNSDGLYVINPAVHSPLIGFAFDGFPIYGAYGYANKNGTGGIVRIKSGYQKRTITTRTTLPDGSTASFAGPAVSTTYPVGTFKEDYVWVSNTSEDYLDQYNGRFCVTPEYPNGTYCYFATVDDNHNSVYPYLIGPQYYGVVGSTTGTTTAASIPSTALTYDASLSYNELDFNKLSIVVAPNPASDLIKIQAGSLVEKDLKVELIDITGKLIKSTKINAGQTYADFDIQTLHSGVYFVKVSNGDFSKTEKVIVE